MGKGAIHFTGSNFAIRRRLRWDILDRMRKLVDNGTYERPRWLEWVERAPPLETRNLLNTDRVIKNPYISLISTLLNKYPHLRFEKCLDDENQWQKGYDNYKSDHPVMQFVSHQLSLMNKGISREEAFKRVERIFYNKRIDVENRLKIAMALAVDEDVEPLYTSGFAYLNDKIAQNKHKLLLQIRNELRRIKEDMINNSNVKK